MERDVPEAQLPPTSPERRAGGAPLSGPPAIRRVLTGVGACLYQWDLSDDAVVWSEGAAGLLGADPRDLATGRRFDALLKADSPDSRSIAVRGSAGPDTGEGVAFRAQYALSADRLGGRSDVWLEDVGRWYAGADGRPQRAEGVVRIVTERRRSEEAWLEETRRDALTGLVNRAHMDVLVSEALERGERFAFLLVGLSHFDILNAVYGYEAGDAVIAKVAERVQANLRDVDVVARYSGAKLCVLLPGIDAGGMATAGQRILNVMREHLVDTPRGPVATSVSIGAVALPRHGRTLNECYTNVNEALTEARRAKEPSLVAFRPDPVRALERRRSAETADRIVTALREGDIHLAFQPVVRAGSGEVAFHEALIRLGTQGTMEAQDFVQTACDLGLVRLVDHHALGQVLAAMEERRDVCVSLNVSADTACDPEWISRLASAIHRQPDIAPRLIVEITESHAAESLQEAARFLSDVHDLGCRVALDDFGAGFTSFRNLKVLPFDIIKVDGQFVSDLAHDEANRAFIRALVDLARLHGAETVVEWVEDEETARLLDEWGVDYLQGFRFGRPDALPAADARAIA